MPRHKGATSGYARIAQEEEDTGGPLAYESDDDDPYEGPTTLSAPVPRYLPIQPRPHAPLHAPSRSSASEYRRPHGRRSRLRSNSSSVDIKAINARLERWADEIASKFKRTRVKGRPSEEPQLEIHYSVFQPPEGLRPATAETLELEPGEGGDGPMSAQEFEATVESVRVAIENGMHPKMIAQGSSGSYFARNGDGQVVGVFKPKDEEPYASRNPKWTKWIHRNLFPCCFGRACLIPNLSYVSEAAAYVLDSRLRTHLVPYTDIVYLSSKSFYYDFWDRHHFYRKHKPLPAKVGSFQVFLKGYKDANLFLREHPWPDQHNSSFRTDATPKGRRKPWHETCQPRGAVPDSEPDVDEGSGTNAEEAERRRFFWTDALRQSFREELEKLVILDYIMRNTDRGLDNWMIKVDPVAGTATIVSGPIRLNGHAVSDLPSRPVPRDLDIGRDSSPQDPYRLQKPMTASQSEGSKGGMDHRSISIGAIDNSLSWPWKHPDAWRSFPFGWLFLPVSLIGQPFSSKTREHFLPLLTSPKWWSDTQLALRNIFSQDADFKERMFAKQIAVMKGQAWNVVETLKTSDHGPLELTRRARVYVWDDLVDIPVAVPLRASSYEIRRRRDEAGPDVPESEEMDISAAVTSAPLPQYDLLGLGTSPSELPNPNRFTLSHVNGTARGRFSTDERAILSMPSSPATVDGVKLDREGEEEGLTGSRADPSHHTLPGLTKSRTQSSLDEVAQRRRDHAHRWRRASLVGRVGSNHPLIYDDDIEGDLGYAAAQGMEKNQRKVIVERLEQVKGKSPVFTWW
ncbi:MAG: phosphatidyl inositol kinase [Phylliscum demangeonii]|nr:MAG: phosphatidyl inositol kinase [Phylliscum demangeonii]